MRGMKRRIILSILAAILMMLLSAGAQAATYPESEHPYDVNTDKTWTYKHSKSAYALKVTFSEETAVEWDCDFIYITDSLGTEMYFTHTELSGKTIVLPGNQFRIRLVTDDYDDDMYYGFKITKVTSMTQAEYEKSVQFSISSSGVITGCSGYMNDLVVPDTVNGIKVTGIGDYAFKKFCDLTSVTLPEGVTSIGGDAFYGCHNMRSITLPQSLKSIDIGAFCDCDSMTSIVFPDGVTDLGPNLFYDCDSLSSVKLPKNLKILYGSTFEMCSKLTSITLPEGLTDIYYDAFSGCMGLKSVTLPGSLNYISSHAFYFCEALTSITIPASVTEIGDYAFAYAGLKEVAFPGKTMPKMGERVFEECKPTVYCYFGSAAEMWAIEQGYEVEYLPLDTMVLPEDLTYIEAGAFMGVDAGEVIIPNGCKSIGSRAFADCKGLWMVTVPESVDFIADNAFEGCVSVTFTGVYGSCAEEFANAHGFDFVGE